MRFLCCWKGSQPLSLSGATAFAEDQGLDPPDRKTYGETMHQKWHNHSIDEVGDDGGVGEEPKPHQYSDETKDALWSVEEVCPSHGDLPFSGV